MEKRHVRLADVASGREQRTPLCSPQDYSAMFSNLFEAALAKVIDTRGRTSKAKGTYVWDNLPPVPVRVTAKIRD